MPKSIRNISLAIGALIGLLVLVAVALRLFLDVDAYKPRFEAAATRVLGLEVRVGGRLGVGFFPGLLVTLEDVHLRNRGADIAAARQVRLGIDFLPLLKNEVRVGMIALEQPNIHIDRDREGKFNYQTPEAAGGALPALTLANASLSDATLIYTDARSGAGFELGHCRLEVSDLRLSERVRPSTMKDLSLAAELACGEVRTHDYTASDLKISVTGKNGVFDLKPATMSLFGGQGSGAIRADFAGDVPLYQVRYAISQFRIEALLKPQAPEKAVEGAMDFAAQWSMRGKTMNELRRSVQGQTTLRGKNLTLNGRDLDQEFARFESSQNFSLVDVGAVIFTGPFGLVVTKGYDFGRIFQGRGGHSEIRTLISAWKVDHGVAQAQDVAMATKANRVALQGSLDLVNERFDDVTMALVDAKGCAKVRQKITGSFQKPVVEKPSTLRSLSGPVLKLLKKVENLFPGGDCDVFYAGSVAAPR
ncbi:MAG: AsmA family protein [Hydrogenophilaceae bacterium]